MMKSKYLVVALSAVALAACNNEDVLEVNQGRGISFQVATEASTRATATTTNTISEFNVWGFTNEGETLMNDVKVSKADGKWSYGTTIFWPNAGTVDFYAVSPKECGGTVNVTNSAKTITDFIVNADVSKQVDLLYALKTGESKAAHEDGATPVKLNFRHALSQIVFKAKNTNSNLSVDIKGVRVAKVVTGGDFTFPTLATSTQLTTDPGNSNTETDASWGRPQEHFIVARYVVDFAAYQEVGATKGCTIFSIIASDVPAGDGLRHQQQRTFFAGQVYYTISSRSRNNISCFGDAGSIEFFFAARLPCTTDEYREVAIPVANITWKQGKKYVYTFIFGEGGGYVPPTDEDDTENPDPDDDEPQPGDPVLVPISFEVTVDDFQDGDAVGLDMIEKDGE